MQLDTRLPLLAAQQPALQFQRETQLESLGKIAPAINAMRQLQAQQIDMETELRKRQAFDQFRAAAQQAGLSGDLGQLAQVFFTHGQSPEHFKFGTELMKAAQEDARNRRLFGTGEGGEPSGTLPPARPAAAAPAAIQAPASQVAPEMAFYGAGGGRPANAMMAMEAPAPMPAQPSAPQGYSFAGKTYPAPVVQEMLALEKHRPLALEIIKANEPKQDEIANRMLKMGLDPSKQSDWASYYKITQPAAVLNEQRLELDRQRADLESKRFALSQAKTQQEMQVAQRNLALSERRMDLAMRQFDLANNPEFQAKLAGAKEAAQIAAKDDSAALQQAPGAIEAGQRTLALLNRMVGDPKGKGDAAKPHPGFTGVIGATFTPGMRLVPGTPEADFDRMLEQVLGGAFLEAYERLKGTGQITEIEGQKATQAITRMGRSVSESEFLAAASEFRAAVETALTRTQARLSRAQSRTAPAPTAQPAGAAAAPAAGGRTFPQPPQAAIDALKRGQGTDAQFDAIFGPGAAARARGR